MTGPRGVVQYEDIYATLDTILSAGKAGTMYFPTKQLAHTWASRANRARIALRRQDELRNDLLEGEGTCIYDKLMFRKLPPEEGQSPEGLWRVRIEFKDASRWTLVLDGEAAPAPLVEFNLDDFTLEDE